MKRRNVKGVISIGIIVLLLTTSIPLGSIGKTTAATQQEIHQLTPIVTTPAEQHPSITFYTVGKQGMKTQYLSLSSLEIQKLYETYQDLLRETTANPASFTTQQLQEEFADLLLSNSDLSDPLTKNQLLTLMRAPFQHINTIHPKPILFQTKASEWFCNFACTGQGSAFPIIILPRLIPIVMTPIPRVFVGWKTQIGLTSCGGLLSGTGFVAGGEQQGFALGFWGIGFSIFLPPVKAYGMFGYALFARVTAEEIEFYPPNNPPEIMQTDPTDGEVNVPISTSELRFEIADLDGDPMSYNVTTIPDIGSGSGGLKPDGIYTVSVSGLQEFTTYTWSIEVTDGKDVVERTMTFTTEVVSPIVSNPLPEDGERDVPMNLPQIQFTLKDYQGNAMEYTMETSPDIGSDHKIGVHDGIYSVPISGMTFGAEYRWYVNVTDGTYWTRKTYRFTTGYPSPFNPFEYGWQYRKQITINHTQVVYDLENFPVLLDITDPDLSKAQVDGDDLLFMTDKGAAIKLRHENEHFDQAIGTLTSWINIPSLSSENDTVFYMYYGNPNCCNQEYPEKVWNNHYRAVWHLNTNPTQGIFDSTKNNNDGTAHGAMTSSDLISGKISSCLDFDGIDDFISFAEFTDSHDIGTCTAWVRTTSSDVGAVWGEANMNHDKPYIVFGKYQDDLFTYARDIYGGETNYQGRRSTALNNGEWHQVAWSSKGSGNGNMFYFDGQPISFIWQDNRDPNGIWLDDQFTDTHSIGSLNRPTNDWQWTGPLDEIRIADTPLSESWIATEFANQNHPVGFVTVGIEETGP